MMDRRKCTNHPDKFCYICGLYTPKNIMKSITKNVKTNYKNYFNCAIGDQDKSWAPHIACQSCVNHLNEWANGKRPSGMSFAVPMIWRESSDHSTDCYFCVCNVKGYSVKTRNCIVYPNLKSALRPIPHSVDLPVPLPPASKDGDDESEDEYPDDQADTDYLHADEALAPKLFSQEELHDLIRDLDLPKEKAELLGSRLKQHNLLQSGVCTTTARHRHKKLSSYYKQYDKLSYCDDVNALMTELCNPATYRTSDWRLFIDSGKNTLKAVLLHNGNELPSVPVAHAYGLTECYETMEILIDVLDYNSHQWSICGDLKVVSLLLGLQTGYTKHMCFLCLWNSRDDKNHYLQSEWPIRPKEISARFNCVHRKLVDPNKVFLPPLHLKLGLAKNFLKTLKPESSSFLYLVKKFKGIVSEAKLKAGVLNGPQIRSLINDVDFSATLTTIENNAWLAFIDVVRNFLGNRRADNYKELVHRLLQTYHQLGVRMSLKIHFFHSHLNFFPPNLGDVSDEQGERFHQDISTMESRYQGRFSPNMLGDYCWTLKREADSNFIRKSKTSKHF